MPPLTSNMTRAIGRNLSCKGVALKVAGLFAGAGGLDRGFSDAGFDLVWANEYDAAIWETYRANHPGILNTEDIRKVESSDIPDVDGIVGGPPCQSWSAAGALRGIKDPRGQLFYEFIRILKDKQPKFFLAENVAGMMAGRHSDAVANIREMFEGAGYTLSVQLVNAADYGVPQDRKRLIFVGFRNDLNKSFVFPDKFPERVTIREAIGDLDGKAVPAAAGNKTNGGTLAIPNHEYMTGGFSTIFLSRNRVRDWDSQSFTIQAGGRHAPIHPSAPRMLKIENEDRFTFAPGFEDTYRRLSVREAARIQTFPDDFIFKYNQIADGYKMIGNAVPVQLGYVLARAIKEQLSA